MLHSFSRKGNAYDNVGIESFHSTIKKEEIQHKKYYDFEEIREIIFEYIESWYNHKKFAVA